MRELGYQYVIGVDVGDEIDLYVFSKLYFGFGIVEVDELVIKLVIRRTGKHVFGG